MKRDAYECYAADCSKTAGWARRSFERLWETCEPMADDLALAAATVAATEMHPAITGVEGTDGQSGPSAD
jgi:hypothetical protein